MINRIFYDWLPKKLDFWLLLFLNITMSFTNGIPNTITNYVIGAQSSVAADINMASFAYYTGMVCVFPIILRLKQFTNTKLILGCSFTALVFLNFVLSQTNAPLVMVMASFAIGAVKMIANIEIVLSLIPILMPKGERYQLYCIYYPLSMVFGSLSGLIAAAFANSLNWQYSFHVQNLFLMIGLLVIILFVHPKMASKKIPLFQYDWLGTLLIIASLLLTCYVFSYGLMLDWYASIKIQAATLVAVLLFTLFLQRNLRIKRPIVKFEAFSSWKVVMGFMVLIFFCLFFNTSSLTAPFLNIILKNNPLESARLNTFGIPGYIAGSLLCFLYYKRFMNFSVMAVAACLCFLISNIEMYDLTSSFTGSTDLFWPMFFRAMATIITYISVGIYITSNIPLHYFNDVTMVLIAVRSLFVPLIASTLYSNWFYHGQVIYLNKLANKMDSLNPYVTARSSAVFSSVKTQASLLALRDIYGALILIGIVLLIIIIVFPFHGSQKRIVFNWQNPLHGKEVAQSLPI
jgi:DHA2 family multidrug resistance protein